MRRFDLVIIDGKNLLWRNVDSHRELSVVVDGERIGTGGIYGFLGSVVRIHERYRGSIVVAWEGAQNFRKKLYPPYKLRGEPTPEQQELGREMVDQQERLMDILSSLGVEQYRGKWCEADDVIGRLVAQRGTKTVAIYSGDSDLRQLVTGGEVVAICNDYHKDRVYDAEAVEEKHGVPPILIPELKALAGDSSDKIPGAPGIGEKTAANVLARYRSLDRVIEAAKSADPGWPDTPRRREIIARHAKEVALFLRLTRIRTDMPWIHRKGERSQRDVIAWFRRYRFRSLETPSELNLLMRLSEAR